MTVWALEGLPFSGKTTSADLVQAEAPTALVLSDYHDRLSPIDRARYAQVPSSAADQSERVRVYLDIDAARWTEANRSSATTLFDRCHLSLLAYSRALAPEMGHDAASDAAATVQRALDDPDHPLRWPDRVIYLEMTPDTATARWARLATSMDDRLGTVAFATNLIEAYDELLTNAPVDVTRLSSEQALPALSSAVSRIVTSGAQ